MDLLRALHNIQFNFAGAALFPTPLALASLLLFVWSLALWFRPALSVGFMWLLRLTWALFLLPGVTGVALALMGRRVPSAVPATPGGQTTIYGFPPDPSRNWEHWMYSAFVLISLYACGALLSGRWLSRERGARFVPVAALFLYGVAYMVGRVAILPGASAGT